MMAKTENETKELHFNVIFNCEMYQRSKCHEFYCDFLFLQNCVLSKTISI